MEDLEFENFSLQHLQTSFRHLMSKLKFSLPDKLYLPVTYFVISNYVANQIQITANNIVISYDPRSLGLMSKKVQHRLQNIVHPNQADAEEGFAYSVTLDQNLLNALIMEMTTTKQQLSFRKVASIFDRRGDYIKMATTSLLALNMPMVLRDYGVYKQMDLVATIDSDAFHHKKQDAPANGFTIDEKGRITGTLNMVSYLKVAPEESLSYPPGSSESSKSKQKQKMNRANNDEESDSDDDSDQEIDRST